jgi:type II secretory pathway component PulC
MWMVKLLIAITCHLILSNVVLASTFPDLIGQIVSSSSYRSLAIFKNGERVYAKRIGEKVNGSWITSIDYRYIYLQDASGKIHQLQVGTKSEPKFIKKMIPGLEIFGDHIIMTEQFKNYIAEENLLSIMFQAASEPFYDDDWNTIGYMIFEIEPDSIYDLVGIRNYDVITHIDGVCLDNPWTAISMLKSVKNQGNFTFTYLRNDSKTTVDVSVIH